MSEKPLDSLIDLTLMKIKEIVDVNTAIGKPVIVSEDVTIIPVSKLTYGFASGGSEFSNKKESKEDLFGGGSGAGVTVSPVAFIVINAGNVTMLRVENCTKTVDKALDVLPDIVEKMKLFFKKKDKKEKKPGESSD